LFWPCPRIWTYQTCATLRDLDGAAQRVLNSTIQFVFGTQHSSRIQDWFDQVLPQSRLTSRVRSFELALDLVSAGLGVCVVPALTVMVGDQVRKGVRLYAINLEPRRIVAMVPSQYLRVPPYGAFLSALQSVGQAVVLPSIETMPPFIAAAAIGMAQIDMSDAAAQ
jgi:DNA-binding transcriptional LysR family regulator